MAGPIHPLAASVKVLCEAGRGYKLATGKACLEWIKRRWVAGRATGSLVYNMHGKEANVKENNNNKTGTHCLCGAKKLSERGERKKGERTDQRPNVQKSVQHKRYIYIYKYMSMRRRGSADEKKTRNQYSAQKWCLMHYS